MGITDILGGLKGQVLNAVNIELLKSAYELQDENMKQLQTNNDLLQEKGTRLEKENKGLKETVSQLQGKLDAYQRDTAIVRELSEEARAILEVYKQADETMLFDRALVGRLPYSKVEIKVAFDELEDAGLAETGIISPDRGIGYFLTKQGRKYLVKNDS